MCPHSGQEHGFLGNYIELCDNTKAIPPRHTRRERKTTKNKNMNQIKMSLFMPPISPVKDNASGRTVRPPTLKPLLSIGLQEVYQLITRNERLKTLTRAVRQAAEEGDEKKYRMLKQHTLPYVTPCGVFSYRRSDKLIAPSGLVVVDIDHLDSQEEAERLKRQLFDDPLLTPALVFTSPGGRGVKAFVPYGRTCATDPAQNAAENTYWAMNYIQAVYTPQAESRDDKGVDPSGKDPARACFLSNDSRALIRL